MSQRPAMFLGGAAATLGGVLAFWIFRNSDSLIITGLLTGATFVVVAAFRWLSERPPMTRPAAFEPVDILPIEIRPGVIVRIAGIPHDLTKAEAEKIAAVVMAHILPRPAEDTR